MFLPAVVAVAAVVFFLLHPGSRTVGILCLIIAGGSAASIGAGIVRARSSTLPKTGHSGGLTASEQLVRQGSIASTVAHEIRNPLSALDIHAQLLEENLPEGDAGAEARKHLDIIRSETHRLNLIVENFIRFARHKPLDSQPVQMPKHLENVLRLIESEAKERNISIGHADLRTDLPLVVADPDQLEQAFLNVVINALQSMPTGGRLTLASREVGEYVECTISNTGPRIPPEILDNIFDLYFTTKEDGSGLGLPIAHKILSEHGGYVTVNSYPSQTSFFLGIPKMAGG